MTKKQIFDKVWDHFVTKKSPKSSNMGNCRYRKDMTPGCPARCAAGLFIPDELYDPAMEDKIIGEVIRKYPALEEHFVVPAGPTFWSDLQSCHDYAARGGDFQEGVKWRLTDFADDYGLTIPSE